DLTAGGNEPVEEGAKQRLAAREAERKNAQRLRFAAHAAPDFGAELVAKSGPGEHKRVPAVGTLERTAIGQLREEPERLWRHGRNLTQPPSNRMSPFAASASRKPVTSCWTPSTP